MEKSKGNVKTFGLSGKIGNLLVFRQRAGQTIAAKLAEPSKKSSEKQEAHRKFFQQATISANVAVGDTLLKRIVRCDGKDKERNHRLQC
jgi:hypothetical protein